MDIIKDSKYFSLPVDFSIEKFEDSRFLKLRLRFMHNGKNPNDSYFDLNTMKEAESSIANIPILAYIIKSDKDFGEHEIGIEESYDDDTGRKIYKTIYYEKPIGVVPEVGNNYHYEDIEGKTYAFVDAYIWREYAPDEVYIIERDKVKKMSMEIRIYDSYEDKENNVTNILNYQYNGLTLLGDNYGTGMLNANAQIINYSGKTEFNKMINLLNQSMKNSSYSKILKINNSGQIAIKYSNKKTINLDVFKIQLSNYINKDQVLSEAFLEYDSLNYLHHKLVNNQLIVDKNVLQSYESMIDILSVDSIKHLYKHYRELNLDTSIFDSVFKEGESVAKKAIDIDNSKESSVSGKWSDPGKALYDPIIESSNAESAAKEGYLQVDEDWKDAPSSKLHYPHHVMIGDKMVVHKDGVESALSRARSQGLTGVSITHLKKHYKELELNMENFIEKGDTNMAKNKFDKSNVDNIVKDSQVQDSQTKAIALQERLSAKMCNTFEEMAKSEDEDSKKKFESLKTKYEDFVSEMKQFSNLEDFEDMAKRFEDFEDFSNFDDFCNKYDDFKVIIGEKAKDNFESKSKEESQDEEEKTTAEEDKEKGKEDFSDEDNRTPGEKAIGQKDKMPTEFAKLQKDYIELETQYKDIKEKYTLIFNEKRTEQIKAEFSVFSNIFSEKEIDDFVKEAVESDKDLVILKIKSLGFDKINFSKKDQNKDQNVFEKATFGLNINTSTLDSLSSKDDVWERSQKEVK